ncbi:MAG: hypothetical protein QOG82_2531 [Actinomycetota bacterium]|jgi:hypothetical protein|nr:hypothetical protein [Actinomycetota bacterium]
MRTRRRIEARGIEGTLGLVTVVVLAFAVVAGTGQQAANAAGPPLLSNQASASQVTVSDTIFDTATLGNGRLPGGVLTFKLFGPDDATCAGKPIFTTATVVAGNGYYESARYTPSAVGTYRWMAVYGGDAQNVASSPTMCTAPAAQVVVSRRTPTFRAAPSTVQPTTADTAVLTMGANPGGTITFTLFGPNNPTCTGTPSFTSVRPVTGNDSYTSAMVGALPLGTYRWVASYSGDANNVARATSCSDVGNGFTLSAAVATVVTVSPAIVSRGGTVTVSWSAVATPTPGDWVGLYKVGTPEGGPVTAWKYTSGTASGSSTIKLPWSATGQYEVRLMADNTTRRLAAAGPITVLA